jgi:hypothetical protein
MLQTVDGHFENTEALAQAAAFDGGLWRASGPSISGALLLPRVAHGAHLGL